MKKVFRVIVMFVLMLTTGLTFTACKKIDGDKWTATKAIYTATCIAGADTETENDNRYDVTLAVTYSVAVTDNKTSEIKKSDFKLSHNVISWYMHNNIINGSSYTPKETVTISGDGASTTVNWLKLEIVVGSGMSKKELENFQKKFNITYKGTKINLPKVTTYK